jgi:peptidoglycan-N-acetylglucosamine deacetylase
LVVHIRRSSRVPAWVAAALAVAILAVACGTDPSPPPAPVTWSQVLNSSVPGDAVGQDRIQLINGRYSVLTGDEAGAIDVTLHDLHAAGDLDGNKVEDEVGLLVSLVGAQLRTESVVGFLAAPGPPAATAAYPLPAGYRVEGLSVDPDGVAVTYTSPRLQGNTYDEIKGRLVLRLEDNAFVEVDRTEEAVPMAEPEPLGVEPGNSTDRSGELGYEWRARFAQTMKEGDRLEIRLSSPWAAATLGVFAPDGSVLLAPEAGGTNFIVEKAVAGDYVIHLVGGAGTPAQYSLNVLRKAAPASPAAPASSGLPAVPDPGEKVVYLTFDDGPDGRYTPKILAALRKYDARATFFVVGTMLQNNRAIAKQIVEQGSTLANHTWDHKSLQGMSRDEFRSVVGRTQDLMGSLGTKCLRPPYGATDANTETYAREMGLAVWTWSIDTIDYRKPSPDMIAERAVANAGPGSVILMHDGGGDRTNTVAAVPKILEQLKAKGYRFEALCR